jgi:hypothetical protein
MTGNRLEKQHPSSLSSFLPFMLSLWRPISAWYSLLCAAFLGVARNAGVAKMRHRRIQKAAGAATLRLQLIRRRKAAQRKTQPTALQLEAASTTPDAATPHTVYHAPKPFASPPQRHNWASHCSRNAET